MEKITNQEGLQTIAAPTDRRAYDDWAYDDEFCHQFLLHITATHPEHKGRSAIWDRAIKRYWRERCTRRELADDVQIGIDAAKSLITVIRKAAEKFNTDGHAGFKSDATSTASWTGIAHTINRFDILAIAEGDRQAIAHAEEYHRLTVRNQLSLFDPAISNKLAELADESDSLGTTQGAGHLIAKADELKANVAKPDQFEGRPLIQTSQDVSPTTAKIAVGGRVSPYSQSASA